ncbi:hypothetical protein CFN79_14415 [Chromobacterium vaccinii]|uniref:Uncharacterized protein n=1 Tax=Pseudogulbenkiania ferrooxidans EGD-HP2 TaxID=1388764 RepID=A0ABN0N4M1_9NEIS|nr:hypothetical protein CFN79_14415 [Chromobacterium vaccinii]ERE04187.1 hypothetical protein O166_01625 [Pseudogulbenkiania ferrooxidans EGD-HP2]
MLTRLSQSNADWLFLFAASDERLGKGELRAWQPSKENEAGLGAAVYSNHSKRRIAYRIEV